MNQCFMPQHSEAAFHKFWLLVFVLCVRFVFTLMACVSLYLWVCVCVNPGGFDACERTLSFLLYIIHSTHLPFRILRNHMLSLRECVCVHTGTMFLLLHIFTWNTDLGSFSVQREQFFRFVLNSHGLSPKKIITTRRRWQEKERNGDRERERARCEKKKVYLNSHDWDKKTFYS